MPTYRFIDYNELTSKPADVDMFAIYDIDGNELKKFSYATLKSFFVKTDEPTDIEATVEFQSTSTKPNSLLKFGSAGEFRIYSNGTDFFLKGTNAAGKLRFYANSIEMFAVDPLNSSIATKGNAINNDGAAGLGINFDSSNRPVLLSILQCNAGIATKTRNVSYTGANDTGLEFDTSNNGIFNQNLNILGNFSVGGTITGTVNFNGEVNCQNQINANKSGTWSIDAIGQVRIGGDLYANGHIILGANDTLKGGDGGGYSINVDGDIRAGLNKQYYVGPIAGITATIPNTFNTITVKGGIISGYT